jgi:hypothetical protein
MSAADRIRRFLAVYGNPSAPIETAFRHDVDTGKPIYDETRAPLFAADLVALLADHDAMAAIDDLPTFDGGPA